MKVEIDAILRCGKPSSLSYYHQNSDYTRFLLKLIILYACETCPTSKEDKKKRKFYKRIFGPKKNNQIGENKIR